MNIRNNIANYLFDKDYCICTYDNYVYVYKYNYLESFNDKRIVLKLKSRNVTILGDNLIIVRITKDEILVKGDIGSIGMDK